jgi:hypothetical protein
VRADSVKSYFTFFYSILKQSMAVKNLYTWYIEGSIWRIWTPQFISVDQRPHGHFSGPKPDTFLIPYTKIFRSVLMPCTISLTDKSCAPDFHSDTSHCMYIFNLVLDCYFILYCWAVENLYSDQCIKVCSARLYSVNK